jgi:hypothetical protein
MTAPAMTMEEVLGWSDETTRHRAQLATLLRAA